jgi:hypothetical protein
MNSIEYSFEKLMFSPEYREAVRMIKKAIKADQREEEKLDDIRSSEGAGKQGPANRAPSIPTRRYKRRNSGEKSGPADNEAENDRDAGSASSPVS